MGCVIERKVHALLTFHHSIFTYVFVSHLVRDIVIVTMTDIILHHNLRFTSVVSSHQIAISETCSESSLSISDDRAAVFNFLQNDIDNTRRTTIHITHSRIVAVFNTFDFIRTYIDESLIRNLFAIDLIYRSSAINSDRLFRHVDFQSRELLHIKEVQSSARTLNFRRIWKHYIMQRRFFNARTLYRHRI